MDLLLDSADLSAIAHALEHYPIKGGVTTNPPTMLSAIEGGAVLSHLQRIRGGMIGGKKGNCMFRLWVVMKQS